MIKAERVFVIIDGSNFYHRLKELSQLTGSLLAFNYSNFVQWLARDRIIAEKKYCIGVVRAKPNDLKAQTLRSNQQRLFTKLKRDGWSIAYGYILDTGDGYHEKGVDVQISVDLLIGAYENLYDTAILVSSDTDLLPALSKVRSMKKKIEYVGFSHKPSLALITHSDIRRLLTKDELQQFLTDQK